jgi:hypothetical protein
MKAAAVRTTLRVVLTAVVVCLRVVTVFFGSACVVSRRWTRYACLAFSLFLIITTQVDAWRLIRNTAVAGSVPMSATALAERSLAR